MGAQFTSEFEGLTRVLDPEARSWTIEPFESALPKPMLDALCRFVLCQCLLCLSEAMRN